jgi:hypothetical protein
VRAYLVGAIETAADMRVMIDVVPLAAPDETVGERAVTGVKVARSAWRPLFGVRPR